jgi:hypothetical protein
MDVIKLALADLTLDPENARLHNEVNLEAIKESLKKFGQVEPLIVRAGTSVVVGGNGRLQAMRELGWKSASCHVVDLTDDQARALALALNRTAELADWDYSQLASAFENLDREMLVGWSPEQVDALLTSVQWAPGPLEPVDFGGKDDDLDVEVDREEVEGAAGNVFVTVVLPDEDLRTALKVWCKANGARLIK